jgi:hypothetical protein
VITERDLQDAIAECQGERRPNANTCIKLAAYLTIYDHLYPKKAELTAAVPQTIFQTVDEDTIGDYGDSDFCRAINGRKAAEIWPVMNELMETIQIINPRLYDGVMRQLM